MITRQRIGSRGDGFTTINNFNRHADMEQYSNKRVFV